MKNLLKNIRDIPLAVRIVWCYFGHTQYHIGDESIGIEGEPDKWYCTKCKKGWKE